MDEFSGLIRNWYQINKRNLPWRKEKNPYYIWLSEVILQQTQVVQGLNYYLKFKAAFPSIKSLAKSDEETILKLWQGLGYYSRARNLHYAAKQILNDYGGHFPKTFDEIIKLKGVGDYTAAAISSFAFEEPRAVVDGNVFRVLSRVFKISTPINSGQGKKEFTKLANTLLSQKMPGEHNQAIMELGALVCRPKLPDCQNCPLQTKCLSYADQTQLSFPVKNKNITINTRHLNYLIITDGNHLLIKKRSGKGIWQGLYDFPMIETTEPLKVVEHFEHFEIGKQKKDLELKHILTHQRLEAKFWIIFTESKIELLNYITINKSDIEDYPLPQLIVRYINESDFFRR